MAYFPTAVSISSTRQRDSQAQTHLVKHVLQPLLRQSRALHIFDRPEFPCETFSHFTRHRSLFLSGEFLDDLAIVPQIDLRAEDEARHIRIVVVHLWEPLLLDVLKRRRGGDAEANEKNVCLRVR